jgi:hypothetical protein
LFGLFGLDSPPDPLYLSQVVRPEVRESVNAYNGVEEVPDERQGPGIGMEREHAVLDARIPDALHVLRSADLARIIHPGTE